MGNPTLISSVTTNVNVPQNNNTGHGTAFNVNFNLGGVLVPNTIMYEITIGASTDGNNDQDSMNVGLWDYNSGDGLDYDGATIPVGTDGARVPSGDGQPRRLTGPTTLMLQ